MAADGIKLTDYFHKIRNTQILIGEYLDAAWTEISFANSRRRSGWDGENGVWKSAVAGTIWMWIAALIFGAPIWILMGREREGAALLFLLCL